MQDYKKLQVWNDAINLASEIYLITENFPRNEIYGLTSQARRASVSVSLNIAEGCGRSSKKDFSHFISISIGSLNELETILFISNNLFEIKADELQIIVEKVVKLRKMLISFRSKLI